MNKYLTFKSAIKTGFVMADSLAEAAKKAGLAAATVCDGVAFQWFSIGDRSFAVEVVEMN